MVAFCALHHGRPFSLPPCRPLQPLSPSATLCRPADVRLSFAVPCPVPTVSSLFSEDSRDTHRTDIEQRTTFHGQVTETHELINTIFSRSQASCTTRPRTLMRSLSAWPRSGMPKSRLTSATSRVTWVTLPKPLTRLSKISATSSASLPTLVSRSSSQPSSWTRTTSTRYSVSTFSVSSRLPRLPLRK